MAAASPVAMSDGCDSAAVPSAVSTPAVCGRPRTSDNGFRT